MTEDEHLIINLLPSIDDTSPLPKSASIGKCDMWLQCAHRLYLSIEKMTLLLDSKKSSYCKEHCQLEAYDFVTSSSSQRIQGKDGKIKISPIHCHDAKTFESSITEFVTSSASQIDSLRVSLKNNPSFMNKDKISHRNGIISHLVSQLQNLVVEKFAEMQRVRNRKTLKLWNNPFCINISSEDASQFSSPSLLFESNQDDLWKKMAHQLEDVAFLELYGQSKEKEEELQSLAVLDLSSLQVCPVEMKEKLGIFHFNAKKSSDKNIRNNASIAKDTETISIPQLHDNISPSLQHNNAPIYDEDNEVEIHHIEELQKESAYLKAKIESAQLDSVQKVEGQMMQITSLLSQFSTLVSEQQEEISNIHDFAVQSKANMVKGNEQLVDATERKKKSKHYFSIIIFSMGLILFALNWIVP